MSAKEQRSGQQAEVTVQAAHGLSTDEVDKLVMDSVANAHADFTARRLIEFRNKATADLKHTDKALAEAGDGLTLDQRQSVFAARAARPCVKGMPSSLLMDVIATFTRG